MLCKHIGVQKKNELDLAVQEFNRTLKERKKRDLQNIEVDKLREEFIERRKNDDNIEQGRRAEDKKK